MSKDYKIAFCTLCERYMSYVELQEGVSWIPESPSTHFHSIWDQPEPEFAHRRCWKHAEENLRAFIRANSEDGPVSFEQLV